MSVNVARARQTDQTTTLCVQEVEIYLERWEVLGALVDGVCEKRSVKSVSKTLLKPVILTLFITSFHTNTHQQAPINIQRV